MSTNQFNRDALIVGICQYDDLPMSPQLDMLVQHAEELAKLLEQQGGFKVKRLPCTDKKTLDLKTRLTLPELEQAIDQLLYPPKESPTQTALLCFVGHGLVKSSRSGTEGFLATSEANGKSVYGLSLKILLHESLRQSSVKQYIVFLEACHSGELFKDFQVDQKHDYCLITSARAHEEALADGLLTKALLDILDYTHQLPETPWVTNETLIGNLYQRFTTTEGGQRFEERNHGHVLLTNHVFSQETPVHAIPYKGLHYFDSKPEDALYFKGRDKLIEELIIKVRTNSFLAVLGASGNGKSSVIRAGVLYRLQQTDHWHIVPPFTPTADPLTALTNRLGTIDISAWVKASDRDRVIFTLDQFEETFSLCQDQAIRETFFDLLLDAVEQHTEKLCLIVVMRADFLDKCSQYSRLAGYFQNHQHLITRPTEVEIRQIIEEPAKQAGLSVEPHLLAEMITDFKGSVGGLPLLEFALTVLWEKSKIDRLLRYSDYQMLGGIQGILERRATEIYEKSLNAEEQVIAKRIFLELTELGEGRPDTRRLVPQADLLDIKSDLLGLTTTPTLVESVIARLVKEYLLVTDQVTVTVVNIAHDALIEHWSLLKKWLDQSREDLRLQRQLNEGAKAWKKREKALLVGVDLDRAEQYLKTHTERVPLSKRGVEFVQASIRQRQWKRRGIISSIVIPVGILVSFGYWYFDSYIWEKEIYCNQFVKRYGLPECVGELTTEQVQKRVASYRLLRKGSKNPVYKVQFVRRIHGYPIEQFPVGDLDRIDETTILVQRHEMSTSFEEKHCYNIPLQGSQWEFIVDSHGKVDSEKVFDKQGRLLWLLYYSPKGQSSRAQYLSGREFQQLIIKSLEIEYSKDGYEESLRYFGSENLPNSGANNAFLIKQKFNDRGLVIEKQFFDSHEKMIGKLVLRYDTQGNEIEVSLFNAEGQPILINLDIDSQVKQVGVHEWFVQHSKWCSKVEQDFGIDGQLVSVKDGYHKWIARYDEWGNKIEEAYFGLDGKKILLKEGYHKQIIQYGEQNNKMEKTYFGLDGQAMLSQENVHKLVWQYDTQGDKVEESYFGLDGKKILLKEGYHKWVARYDGYGNRIETAFFGLDDQKILLKEGYHKWVTKYSKYGNRIESAYLNFDEQVVFYENEVYRWSDKENGYREGYHKWLAQPMPDACQDNQVQVIESPSDRYVVGSCLGFKTKLYLRSKETLVLQVFKNGKPRGGPHKLMGPHDDEENIAKKLEPIIRLILFTVQRR